MVGSETVEAGDKTVRAGCPSHNCRGRCLLIVHVQDGVITRMGTDGRPGD